MRSYVSVCVIILLSTLNFNTAFYVKESNKRSPNLKSLWNLEEMTECKMHHNALVYNNYGCWCGVGGCCTPVDPIDDCCMHHDKCYDAAVAEKKCYDDPFEYIDNYSWRCDNETIVCNNNPEPCKAALCACDSAVVNCWARYAKPPKKPWCHHKKTNNIREFLQILERRNEDKNIGFRK